MFCLNRQSSCYVNVYIHNWSIFWYIQMEQKTSITWLRKFWFRINWYKWLHNIIRNMRNTRYIKKWNDTFTMFLKYMVKREIPVVIIIPQILKRSFTVNSIICVYSLCYLRSWMKFSYTCDSAVQICPSAFYLWGECSATYLHTQQTVLIYKYMSNINTTVSHSILVWLRSF